MHLAPAFELMELGWSRCEFMVYDLRRDGFALLIWNLVLGDGLGSICISLRQYSLNQRIRKETRVQVGVDGFCIWWRIENPAVRYSHLKKSNLAHLDRHRKQTTDMEAVLQAWLAVHTTQVSTVVPGLTAAAAAAAAIASPVQTASLCFFSSSSGCLDRFVSGTCRRHDSAVETSAANGLQCMDQLATHTKTHY